MNRGSETPDFVQFVEKVASMRPRFMNRGSLHAYGTSDKRRQASMRPRFMNRGSSIDRLHRGFEAIGASMRPRFMNRGSTIVMRCAFHSPELQ